MGISVILTGAFEGAMVWNEDVWTRWTRCWAMADRIEKASVLLGLHCSRRVTE